MNVNIIRSRYRKLAKDLLALSILKSGEPCIKCYLVRYLLGARNRLVTAVQLHLGADKWHRPSGWTVSSFKLQLWSCISDIMGEVSEDFSHCRQHLSKNVTALQLFASYCPKTSRTAIFISLAINISRFASFARRNV